MLKLFKYVKIVIRRSIVLPVHLSHNLKEIRMAIPSKDPIQAWSMIKSSQNKIKVNFKNPDSPLCDENIRFVAISDTHNKHDRISIPPCDVLLHCGDFTRKGFKRSDIEAFDKYLGTLPDCKKILISGNHDLEMEKSEKKNPYCFQNCEYLKDSSTVIFGYKVYGTPWIPYFHHGAFMLDRGEPLLEKWKLIPSDTDILLTHGPPLGYGDKCKTQQHAGDVDLLLEIQNRIKPIMHIFGHIHEGRGCWTDGTTTYVNASICDVHFEPTNEPLVFELPVLKDHPKKI